MSHTLTELLNPEKGVFVAGQMVNVIHQDFDPDDIYNVLSVDGDIAKIERVGAKHFSYLNIQYLRHVGYFQNGDEVIFKEAFLTYAAFNIHHPFDWKQNFIIVGDSYKRTVVQIESVVGEKLIGAMISASRFKHAKIRLVNEPNIPYTERVTSGSDLVGRILHKDEDVEDKVGTLCFRADDVSYKTFYVFPRDISTPPAIPFLHIKDRDKVKECTISGKTFEVGEWGKLCFSPIEYEISEIIQTNAPHLEETDVRIHTFKLESASYGFFYVSALDMVRYWQRDEQTEEDDRFAKDLMEDHVKVEETPPQSDQWDTATRGPKMSTTTGQTIWKYQIPHSERVEMKLPKGAEIIRVDSDGGKSWLWAKVDTNAPDETRVFHNVKTGAVVPSPSEGNRLVYVGFHYIFIVQELGLYMFEEVKND